VTIQEVKIPDIGDSGAIDIIEVCVAPGDKVVQEDSLIVLESDKATIEVPSPFDGEVKELKISVGDKVGEGSVILMMEVEVATEPEPAEDPEPEQESVQGSPVPTLEVVPSTSTPDASSKNAAAVAPVPQHVASRAAANHPIENDSKRVHAGPAVRRLANELGVSLGDVVGTGPKDRILKEDVHHFVKGRMTAGGSQGVGGGLPPLPEIDFSKFGEVEEVELTKIQKLSANFLHRSWVNLPHVTQFDEADITEMDAFRKEQGVALKEQGVKLTPLAFMVKAVAYCLRQFPKFNSSLHSNGETLILKKYCNVGIAVDTPNGLVVPVVKDADTKSVLDIAKELQVLSAKARDRKLSPSDMQGGCFSISSLGGIGGTAFTPIVNWPEVAILGVSRASIKPCYQDGEFVPRLILPLSLSYDHRVVDGADAARFTVCLAGVLGDIRKLLL